MLACFQTRPEDSYKYFLLKYSHFEMNKWMREECNVRESVWEIVLTRWIDGAKKEGNQSPPVMGRSADWERLASYSAIFMHPHPPGRHIGIDS